MKHTTFIVLPLMLGLVAPSAAFAHAFLEHAVPSVGSTVTASPGELQLSFTQAVEAALSGVRVTTAAGSAVPTRKPTTEGTSGSTLHVKLGRPLAAGTYVVHWHVVSVDTHPTSGSYKFTIAP